MWPSANQKLDEIEEKPEIMLNKSTSKHQQEPHINLDPPTSENESNALQDKIFQMEKKLESEREFYEEALEARMNQLEELEQTVERQEVDLKQARLQIDDLESQLNQAQYDNDMLRKEGGVDPSAYSSSRQSELVTSLKA